MPGDYGTPQYTCSDASYCPIHNPTVWVPCLCPSKDKTGPHKCPVCDGHGKRFFPMDKMRTSVYDTHYAVDCHGCDGKGWVTV